MGTDKSNNKGTMQKLMGLFVETGDSAAGTSVPTPTTNSAVGGLTAAEIDAQWRTFQTTGKMTSVVGAQTLADVVKQMPGPDLDKINVPVGEIPPSGQPEPAATPVRNTDGSLDFSGIYRQAGLVSPPFSAENALELIHQIPQELNIDAKRAMIKPMLAALGKSTGATPQTIAGDAASKITALESYREGIHKQVDTYLQVAQNDILELEKKIAQRKAGIENAQKKRDETDQVVAAEVDRLDDVTEFFTIDAGASKFSGVTV